MNFLSFNKSYSSVSIKHSPLVVMHREKIKSISIECVLRLSLVMIIMMKVSNDNLYDEPLHLLFELNRLSGS